MSISFIWRSKTSITPETRARHPQISCICEPFHRTIQEEFYSVAFSKKLYRSLEELQADVDLWIREYK